jgi:hypothetical protein
MRTPTAAKETGPESGTWNNRAALRDRGVQLVARVRLRRGRRAGGERERNEQGKDGNAGAAHD